MFNIEYEIVTASFDNIEAMTDEQLRYDFLLGNIIFKSKDMVIDMAWRWIPLLDFSISLLEICKSLSNKVIANDYFEFTESADRIEFLKNGNILKITP